MTARKKPFLDLVPDSLFRKGLFPAGRLDKDTSGFVLLTDDGDFAHRILSPKNHIQKTYVASIAQPLPEAALETLAAGITLRDGEKLLRPTLSSAWRISGEKMITSTSRILENKSEEHVGADLHVQQIYCRIQ